jgi:patatin-like phospholipase/acyl hydrolase
MYRIISFDGGGLKGLLSLGILRRVSEKLKDKPWIEEADMYAGTSTGGLIALGLAAGKSIGEIAGFYEENGPKIFDKRTWVYRSSFHRTLHMGYENESLKKPLHAMFEDRKLTDLQKEVVVVAFDLEEKEDKRACWAPKIFHNVKGEGQDTDLVRDVGLYTSAAPTYLPSANGYIDGGVCANNPSMCAIAQLMDGRTLERRKLEDILMVSVGTGVNPKSLDGKAIRWGLFGWNVKLLQIIMEGSIGIADYQCKHLLPKDSYRRFQIDLPGNIEMDDPSKIEDMEKIVAGIAQAQIDEWARWIKAFW